MALNDRRASFSAVIGKQYMIDNTNPNESRFVKRTEFLLDSSVKGIEMLAVTD